MALDSGSAQALQVIPPSRGLGVVEQEAPQRRVGGMHGNVERAQALLHNPFKMGLRQVGQGDEMAVQEGQAVVVVPDIDRRPQVGRGLPDETEKAIVVTGFQGMEEVAGKVDPERLGGVFLDLAENLFPLQSGDGQGQIALRAVVFDVDHVARDAAVDPLDPVAWPQAQLRRDAAGLHPGNHRSRPFAAHPGFPEAPGFTGPGFPLRRCGCG